MTIEEFEKIWTLLTSLWPNAAAKKSHVDKAVWRKGLEVYRMDEVSDRILTYARQNKFWPDLADITGHLLRKSGDAEIQEKIAHMEKMLSKMEAKP